MPGKKSSQPDKSLFKRQVEILGLALQEDKKHTSASLQDLLQCETATLNRDIGALRSAGIDIHSVKNTLRITNNIAPTLLKGYILQYIGYCYTNSNYDRATTLLVKKLGPAALHLIVTLELAIERNLEVEIDYEKERGTLEQKRRLGPLILFQADDVWRILAINEALTKQFILNKIRRIRITTTPFTKPSPEKIQSMFAHMWKGWLGKPIHCIKLWISKELTTQIDHRIPSENQKISHNPDGSSILEAGVPELLEVAEWIITKRDHIRVLEPIALQKIVIELAKSVLSVYDK